MSQISREVRQTAPPEDSSAPPNVPDLIRIGAIPSNMTMDVDTDILEPVVKSQSFVRYVLDKKGFLHSNSKLVFAMEAVSAGDTDSFFPANIGVMSLIERATLKVGNKTINEIDDFNQYQGYKSMFLSGENAKERELMTTGRFLSWDFDYNNASGAGLQSNYSASAITLDVNRNVEVNNTDDGVDNKFLPSFIYTDSTAGRQPEFQVALSDLFPFLKANQLPLYMIDEQIAIELRLTPESSNKRLSRNADGSSPSSQNIDLDSLKMIADYVFYPTEIMDAYAQQNPDLTFTYMDYHLSKQGFVADGTNNTEQIRDIGGAGKIVTKVFVSLEKALANPEEGLLNSYGSTGCNKTADSNGSLVSNLRFNGEFLYPIDRENPALQYHDVVTAEGSVPFICREQYSNEGHSIASATTGGGTQFEGNDQASQLGGEFFRQAYKLNRNERVNSRGIELFHTYRILDANTYTQRAWVESVKVANLRNGSLDCYDA